MSVVALPEFKALLRDMVKSHIEGINTCFPAKVLSYDAASETVSVRPGLRRPVRRVEGGWTSEPMPDISGIPLAGYDFGGLIIHFPPGEGDAVLIVVTQWGISEHLRSTDEQVDPGEVAHHSLSGCVAIPGFRKVAQRREGLSATDGVVGRPDGPNIRFSAGGAPMLYMGANGPYKRAAREGDSVRVTLGIGTVNVSGPGGASTNAAPIIADGTITSGSTKVNISD